MEPNSRKIDKAYIIRIDHPLSIERAAECAKSCEEVGIPYEFWKGTQGIPEDRLWNQPPLIVERKHTFNIPTMNATRSHTLLWKHIYDNKETAIILEHDAYMLHNTDLEIPDGAIVVLGYKLMNKDVYDYNTAGPPKEIIKIYRHCGAHAYAITWKTAGELIEELQKYGIRSDIDTGYFMHNGSVPPWGKKDPPPPKQSGIPLMLMSPILALGWVRDARSTVGWGSGAANFHLIPSFKANLKK